MLAMLRNRWCVRSSENLPTLCLQAEPASSLGWNEYNGGDANEWTTANLPGNDPHDEESWMDPMSTEFWIYTSVCLVLVTRVN